MKPWQLQQAKAHLSEVIRRAIAQGPQEITVHGGRSAAVVVSRECFDRLARNPIGKLWIYNEPGVRSIWSRSAAG